jgi:outer membrane protein TolC
MRFVLVFSLFFIPGSNLMASQISLEKILEHQFKSQNQSQMIANQASNQLRQNAPNHSPWLTNITSTLELQNDVYQFFTNNGETTTDSLPLDARVTQSTPYGLSLNLEYRRELLDPSFLGSFTKERYRGSLEFSILRDPLGSRTRKILNNFKDSAPLFKRKAESDQCRDIALKYNEAVSFQERATVLSNTIQSSQKILSGLQKAVRKGAVNKTTASLVLINMENLKAQKASVESNKLRALIELQNLSGLDVAQSTLKVFDSPSFDDEKSNQSLQIDLLKQEVDSLNARLDKLNLDRNHDLSFYAGLESSTFAQNVLNLEGQTDFGFFGVRANLRFSDQDYKNRVLQLKAQIAIKENELRVAQVTFSSEQSRFLTNLKVFQSTYSSLKKSSKSLKMAEERTLRNFRNGKATYNDYLTSQNEILNFKRSLIDAKENFWQTYYDYEHFKGDSQALCMRKES